MERMTKVMAIAILITVTQAQAGWLSNIGQRIVNGAINTVQTNISGKVNKTIDDAMDGKLAPQQKSNSQSQVDNYSGHPGLPTTGVSAGGPAPIANNQVDSSGMLSSEQVRRRALPFKGVYEEISLGNFKFKGERVYDSELMIGERMKKLDVYLSEGTYMFVFDPISYDATVTVGGIHEREGIQWGYGINPKKVIYDGGLIAMSQKKGFTVQIVEVGKSGGHLEAVIVNEASLRGAMEFTIYKIPGPTLK